MVLLVDTLCQCPQCSEGKQAINNYNKSVGDKVYVSRIKRVESWERLRCESL